MICNLCPRNCGINREEKRGYCGAPESAKIARASLHMWEEPPISGKNGSGAVFFSHCNLKCVFCQNHRISADGIGKEVTPYTLAEIFMRLQENGAENINLVSATPYVLSVIKALDTCKDKLSIPIIWNTGGYESAETLDMLNGYVDIYLPDIKFISRELAKKYLNAPDYPEYAINALEKMLLQVGKEAYKENGMMKSGVIVRHLVMPSHKDESIKILNFLAEKFGTDAYSLSLMRQYYPCHKAKNMPEINRKLTTYEYDKVQEEAQRLGFHGFSQEKESADEKYTPEFDLSGVL